MLEELLKCNNLGSRDELQFVLFDALAISENQKISHLKMYCSSNLFAINRSFSGILKLLEFTSFIEIGEDNVKLNKKIFDPLSIKNPKDYFSCPEFGISIFDALKNEGVLTEFLNPAGLKFNVGKEKFYIKENLIPYKYFPIRSLFLSLGYFERDDEISNHLLINKNIASEFKSFVIDPINNGQRNKHRKRISLEELKKSLERKNEVGKEAELFVLDFEQKRLQGHPSFSSIQRISDDFINAGYDIESFNSKESVIVDRHIEVKSFIGEVSFYWTRTEIEIAQRLNDKYFLYLVDRAKMAQIDYRPRIFENPYQKIFENEYWIKEIENWKIFIRD